MLTQLIHWFKGYLKIQLIGYSPERFLNICKSKNIFVWDLKSCKNHYEMLIQIKDFKKIKPLCKKTVSRVKIIEKIGFPFVLNHLRKRKAYILGCVLTVVFIYFSSFFLWNIEVNGNNQLTRDVIISYLADQQISPGIPLSQLNCKSIASNMRNVFKEIIWVSVSLEGTCMHIELRENTDTDIIQNLENYPTDLIAKYDGVITNIVTRSGIPMVEEGSIVAKGDLLVSGSIPVLNDNKEIVRTKNVKADATILGERNIFYQDKINTKYKFKKYEKRSICFKIGSFYNVPQNKENREIFIDHQLLKIGTIKTYKWIDSYYDIQDKESILTNKFHKFLEQLSANNIKVLESNFVIQHFDDYSIATSNIRLEQAMEESRKIIDLSSDNMVQ